MFKFPLSPLKIWKIMGTVASTHITVCDYAVSQKRLEFKYNIRIEARIIPLFFFKLIVTLPIRTHRSFKSYPFLLTSIYDVVRFYMLH